MQENHYIRNIFTDGKAFQSLALNPDASLFAAGANDGTIALFDTDSKRQIDNFQAHNDWITSLAFSTRSDMLASGSNDFTASVWDTETHVRINILRKHPFWVTSVDLRSGDDLMATVGDFLILLTDPVTGFEVGRINAREDLSYTEVWGSPRLTPLKAVFSPDGGYLAVLSTPNKTIYVHPLPLDSQQQPVALEGTGLGVQNGGLAFSTFEPVLAATGGGYIRVISLEDSGLLYEKKVSNYALTLAFVPNTPLVIVGGSNGILQCHNYREGRLVARFAGHWGDVIGIAVDPVRHQLISVALDGLANIWDIDGIWQPASP